MDKTNQHPCASCASQGPPLTEGEIDRLHPDAPLWRLKSNNGGFRLERTFTFPDFATALDFTNQVGALAEMAQHHPVLVTEWGKVTVAWWTHAVHGLTQFDFVMATKTDHAWADLSKR